MVKPIVAGCGSRVARSIFNPQLEAVTYHLLNEIVIPILPRYKLQSGSPVLGIMNGKGRLIMPIDGSGVLYCVTDSSTFLRRGAVGAVFPADWAILRIRWSESFTN